MVSIHAGNVMCSRLTNRLWEKHLVWSQQQQVRARSRPGSATPRKESTPCSVRRRHRSGERRLSRCSSHGERSLADVSGAVLPSAAQMRANQHPGFVVEPLSAPLPPPLNLSSITDSRHYV